MECDGSGRLLDPQGRKFSEVLAGYTVHATDRKSSCSGRKVGRSGGIEFAVKTISPADSVALLLTERPN